MVGVVVGLGLALGLTGNVEYVIGSCNIPPVVYEIGNILILQALVLVLFLII
jgi:hypothetical protein